MRIKLTLYVLAAIAMSGCATPTVAPEKAARIKSVAVLTAVPEHLQWEFIGLLVFFNRSDTVPVDWRFNDHVAAKAAAELAAKFQVKRVEYDREKLSNQLVVRNLVDVIASEARVGEVVKSLVRAGEVDAYVVVRRASIEDLIGRSYERLEGFGLYKRGAYVAPFAMLHVEVIDGNSFEILASSMMRLPEPSAFGIHLPSYEFVDRSWWRDSFAEMSDQEKERLRKAIIGLIDKSLPFTFRRIGLTQQDAPSNSAPPPTR
jgi:hypothetical protein